ncbi:hypothetical protein NL54_04545 [Pantoea stewartii]|uniref:Secreted protein n=2 Tax=Pantoea stewartii TaxID=66269 RepID=A0AB34VBM3_9GAMM|nr:hypothetical protein DSJ_02270 [Pantoea stewartii subsp. stewartii DC283]KHE02484.1 hypothetical protein NL54_04545 [Pantoea stewartii]KHN63814.1 hypothetical protein OI73_07130 [Pantoea stewartii]KTS28911.1 hypothetical protein NS381_06945 [Pantoea stewartii]KTS74201.1 hypothetical protein RSA30_08115 [Pantoea stewartii]
MESVKSWLMTIITMTAQAQSTRVLRMALGFCDPYLSEAAAQSPRRKTQAKRKLSINTFNADDELSAVIIFIISLRLI